MVGRSTVKVGVRAITAVALACVVSGLTAGPASAEDGVTTPPTLQQQLSRAADTALSVNAAASATTSGVSGCPAKYACAWIDINYTNYMGRWAGNNRDWSMFPRSGCQTGTWDNCASSFVNHGVRCDVVTLRGYSYQDGGVIWYIGDSSPDLRNQWDLQDNISSNYWC